ncbi:hypothetical protein JCM3765_007724 [Sporobolomyces pararoseus]
MDSVLTSRPSGLFKLPGELLYQIFDDVYINWSQAEPSLIGSERPPTSPLCRALVPFQRQGLYRNAFVNVRQNSIRFFKSILAQPRLASLVTSLTLKIPVNSASQSSSRAVRNSTGQVSAEEIQSCFSSFRNLEHLTLQDHTTIHFPSLLSILTSDTLSPKCTSIMLSIPCYNQDALASLPLNPKSFSLEVAEWQNSTIVAKKDTVHRSPFSSLSDLTLTRFPRADYHNKARLDFLARCASLRRLTLHGFNESQMVELLYLPSRESLTQLSLLGGPAFGPTIPLDQVLRYFPNLRQLTLAINYSNERYKDGFTDAVRRLSLEILIFAPPEQPPLSVLEALLSPPNQHPTLRKLQLDCVDRVGTIGTRLSTIPLRFSSIQSGMKVAINDLFPEDWDIPRFPPEYSIGQLKALQFVGSENGVQVAGKIFEALEFREAYEQDVDILKERWDNWKAQGRRTQGKKGK